ncbi:hypothetical protein GCM10028803_00730 [Larkinella knui]
MVKLNSWDVRVIGIELENRVRPTVEVGLPGRSFRVDKKRSGQPEARPEKKGYNWKRLGKTFAHKPKGRKTDGT